MVGRAFRGDTEFDNEDATVVAVSVVPSAIDREFVLIVQVQVIAPSQSELSE